MKPVRICAAFVVAVVAASGFGAETAAAARLRPTCHVYAWNALPMPDGKSYAIGLRSGSEGRSDVRVRLYSDQREYVVNVTGLSFEPLQPSPAATGTVAAVPAFASPVFFVSLPQPDILLGVVTDFPASEHRECISVLTYTEAYQRAADAKYATSAETKADAEDLARIFASGVNAEKALDVTPADSATKVCPVRCRSPAAVKLYRPEYPLAARSIRASVAVRIELDSDDSLVDASIYRSSGNTALDAEALAAARRSEYKTAIFRCHPMPGAYLFLVNFGG